MKIKKIFANEILDSRGWPTVGCIIGLDNNSIVRASVPSGASVGKFEAVELRDGDEKRFLGRGVLKAIENIEKKIAPALVGKSPNLFEMDKILINLDGTENKSNLGANATLAVSIAISRAHALSLNLDLFSLVQNLHKSDPSTLLRMNGGVPKVMFNILNGGVHANNETCFQEFMIMPMHECFAENLEMAVVVYQNLKNLLKKNGYSVGVGDEGGFAPKIKKSDSTVEEKALDFLIRAIRISGFEPGKEICLCLDVAATQFYDEESRTYNFYDKKFDSNALINFYEKLLRDFPIFSIEDGLAEQDWNGWKLMTEQIGDKVQLVGDDIFVTNVGIIKKGIDLKIANAVLIKPNQIGTVSQTLDAIKLSQDAGYKTVVSHRSGETCDSFITDLVVGTNSDQLKAGACARSERIAKYNRLLEIERSLEK